VRFLPFKIYRKDEVVLLVNNLGGMGELEMDTMAGDRDCGLTLKAGA
jgi:dihydroxyacetone kinase